MLIGGNKTTKTYYKKIDGKWVYDANSLGSLSCLKANSPPKALTKNK